MSWSAIKGQPLAVRLLRRAVTGNRLAHAYLFAGPPGVGKRLTALELAKALNCLSPTPDGGACDKCASCRKVSADPPTHPDLVQVAPDGRFIRTDQMRDLQSEMYARPTEGRIRVAIIDGAERMNAEAGNRVLKLLEEPPAYAVFILLTHNLAGVLPTILSRCQVVNFPPLAPENVAGVLQDLIHLPEGEAYLYAALSGGSIGRAAEMAGNPGVMERRAGALELLQRLHAYDDVDLLGQSEALEKQKENLEAWLEMATFWLRDALLLSQGAPERLVVNADKPSEAHRLAIRYGSESLMAMLDALAEARGQLLRNANTRLLLDVLLLRLKEAASAANPAM